MLKPLICISSVLLLCLAYIINTDCFSDYWLPPYPIIDSNKLWNANNSTKSDEVRQLSIKVPDSFLRLLSEKINSRSLPPAIPDSKFRYGFNSDYLKTVLKYWSEKYVWKDWEAKINIFPHFLTYINGLQIHFIHIKPTLKPGQKSVPILLLHGWPGSFFEFYKIIPMLTDNNEKGNVVFEVVCPSIPGFGWSDAPEKPGFGIVSISAVMFKLMDRLNVTSKFYVQGGDFGSLIAGTMAKISPSKIAGIHVNMIQVSMHDLRYWIKVGVGAILPKWFHFLSEEDQNYVYPFNKKFGDLMNQMGYFMLQSTRPSTIGIALSDNPVGLSAYILEKFGAWSNNLDHHLNSASGGLEDINISIDEMLTNIMIYYVTDSISSSVRLYKEIWSEEEEMLLRSHPVRIPVGLALFPKEIIKIPREFAVFSYRNIRQFTHMPKGGHFAALEEPDLLAKDVRSFVSVVEKNEH